MWNYQVALQSLEESLTVFKALTKSRLTFSNLETKYLENIESAINDTKKHHFLQILNPAIPIVLLFF